MIIFFNFTILFKGYMQYGAFHDSDISSGLTTWILQNPNFAPPNIGSFSGENLPSFLSPQPHFGKGQWQAEVPLLLAVLPRLS